MIVFNVPEVAETTAMALVDFSEYSFRGKSNNWIFSIRKNHFLTGEVLTVKTYASQLLKGNLDFGNRILLIISDLNITKANFPVKKDWTHLSDYQNFRIKLDKLRNTISLYYKQDRYCAKMAKKIMHDIIESGVGNCSELSVILYVIAQELNGEYEKKKQIRFACVKDGDHFFLVIGSRKNAVICDAWTGTCYPRKDWEKYLKNYALTAKVENSIVPLVSNVPNRSIPIETWT